MPPKRRTTTAKKQNGKGFMDALRAAHKFVKNNKLISRGLGLIPGAGFQTASSIAGQLGYGAPKKKRRTTTTRVARAPAIRVPRVGTRTRRVLRAPMVVSSRLPTQSGRGWDYSSVMSPGIASGRWVNPGAAPPMYRNQNGNGIFSDLGSGIGSIAHGFFG